MKVSLVYNMGSKDLTSLEQLWSALYKVKIPAPASLDSVETFFSAKQHHYHKENNRFSS